MYGFLPTYQPNPVPNARYYAFHQRKPQSFGTTQSHSESAGYYGFTAGSNSGNTFHDSQAGTGESTSSCGYTSTADPSTQNYGYTQSYSDTNTEYCGHFSSTSGKFSSTAKPRSQCFDSQSFADSQPATESTGYYGGYTSTMPTYGRSTRAQTILETLSLKWSLPHMATSPLVTHTPSTTMGPLLLPCTMEPSPLLTPLHRAVVVFPVLDHAHTPLSQTLSHLAILSQTQRLLQDTMAMPVHMGIITLRHRPNQALLNLLSLLQLSQAVSPMLLVQAHSQRLNQLATMDATSLTQQHPTMRVIPPLLHPTHSPLPILNQHQSQLAIMEATLQLRQPMAGLAVVNRAQILLETLSLKWSLPHMAASPLLIHTPSTTMGPLLLPCVMEASPLLTPLHIAVVGFSVLDHAHTPLSQTLSHLAILSQTQRLLQDTIAISPLLSPLLQTMVDIPVENELPSLLATLGQALSLPGITATSPLLTHTPKAMPVHMGIITLRHKPNQALLNLLSLLQLSQAVSPMLLVQAHSQRLNQLATMDATSLTQLHPTMRVIPPLLHPTHSPLPILNQHQSQLAIMEATLQLCQPMAGLAVVNRAQILLETQPTTHGRFSTAHTYTQHYNGPTAPTESLGNTQPNTETTGHYGYVPTTQSTTPNFGRYPSGEQATQSSDNTWSSSQPSRHHGHFSTAHPYTQSYASSHEHCNTQTQAESSTSRSSKSTTENTTSFPRSATTGTGISGLSQTTTTSTGYCEYFSSAQSSSFPSASSASTQPKTEPAGHYGCHFTPPTAPNYEGYPSHTPDYLNTEAKSKDCVSGTTSGAGVNQQSWASATPASNPPRHQPSAQQESEPSLTTGNSYLPFGDSVWSARQPSPATNWSQSTWS